MCVATGEVAEKGGEMVAEGLQAWWCLCNSTSLL
jgi:hypothetical protein